MGLQTEPEDASWLERYLDEARSSVGEEPFSTAWAEGLTMSLQEAVAYVLETSGDG
jgi:hypothetical protein